ncbi:MAG: FAD-binding oxidoreductase [Deltaproteobacteria bacterium]|nr:FAD-binding oxidoreductase [Deltaproteobacteria bacterium]
MDKNRFIPDWRETPPPEKSYRSIFKLGKKDEFKHPSDAWYDMIKKEFGLSDGDFRIKQKEGNEVVILDKKSGLSEKQIEKFSEITGKDNISTDDYIRVKFSHGQMLFEVMDLRENNVRNVSDIVVHPRDKNDVKKIVEYCNEEKIPIYVYSGGSSATKGLTPTKGGVTLVLKTHMNKVLELNEENHTAIVQPGLMGPDYEEALNRAPERFNAKRRYTCGHFPQSFELSSVGGWVVTLGSGQASTYYGDAYHIVLAQEYVTPAGDFKTYDFAGTATGPKVNDIMKGSEGAYGILVELTMRVFRYQPENRKRFAFMFPTWKDAVSASQEIMQGEFGLPAVYRISDPEETERGLKLFGADKSYINKFFSMFRLNPMERCLCVGTVEGETGYVRNVKKMIRKIAKSYGALYLTGFPVKKWEKTRYKEPLMREDMMDYGIIADTVEASVTWDNLHNLHQGVRSYIKKRPRTVCMTHASHFYSNGTNLYFIFILKPESKEEYTEFYKGIVDAMIKHGGSISHHHGMGKLFGPWMETYLGKEQMGVLKALKSYFDPNNIMNPGGTLGLDTPDDEKRVIK